MKQQRATLEKQNAPRNKSGDAVGRPSCRSSLLGDPGAKFLVETGHRNRTTKNSLNYVSTCLKIVDTRRYPLDLTKTINDDKTGAVIDVKATKTTISVSVPQKVLLIDPDGLHLLLHVDVN
jgi:hypothetical protein